jgi:hypothetical protein
MKVPRTLVELGEAMELQFTTSSGLERNIQFRGSVLATNPSRTRLYVFKVKRSTQVQRGDTKAEKSWSLWSGFEPDGSRIAEITSVDCSIAGTANAIVYRSDKWDSRDHDYIHTFTSAPKVFAENETSNRSRLYIISGGKLKVRAAGITG